jgi:hypothetical protein
VRTMATQCLILQTNTTGFIDVVNVVHADDEFGKTGVETLKREQPADKMLDGYWLMAKHIKGNYVVKDGLLYRIDKLFGQTVENLVVPELRRNDVLNLAHEMSGEHLAMKKLLVS